METLLFYIHGFNTGPKPHNPEDRMCKVEVLKRGVKADHVIFLNYDSFANANDIFDGLIDGIKKGFADFKAGDVYIAGTSLGGYLAAWLGAHFAVPSISLNSALDPASSLPNYVGVESRSESGRYFSKEAANSWADMKKVSLVENSDYAPLFLHNEGDEIIDVGEVIAELAPSPAALFTFEGGDHRASVLSLDHELAIESYVKATSMLISRQR